MAELPSATTSPAEFFERWLPGAFAEAELPDSARSVEVELGVRLEGEGGGEWLFRLKGGELAIAASSIEPAPFAVLQSVADWRGCLWEGRGGFFGRQAAALYRPGAVEAPGGAAPLGPAALAELQKLRGLVRMVVAGDPGGDWRIDFRFGPGPAPAEPSTTVTVAAPDAAAMERGELDPMQAFLAGKVQVAGDMALLMQMQAVQMQAALGSP